MRVVLSGKSNGVVAANVMRHAARTDITKCFREGLPTLVDVPTMSDGVHDNRVLGFQDLENNPIRAFSELIQTPKFTFEWKEFRGIQIGREPFKPIDNPLRSPSIELFKLS